MAVAHTALVGNVSSTSVAIWHRRWEKAPYRCFVTHPPSSRHHCASLVRARRASLLRTAMAYSSTLVET
eukprot:scaffold133_cov407-Prasinococcus_capsulatus_cf.AAC.20